MKKSMTSCCKKESWQPRSFFTILHYAKKQTSNVRQPFTKVPNSSFQSFNGAAITKVEELNKSE
jgi:hypothetical protein